MLTQLCNVTGRATNFLKVFFSVLGFKGLDCLSVTFPDSSSRFNDQPNQYSSCSLHAETLNNQSRYQFNILERLHHIDKVALLDACTLWDDMCC